MNGVVRAQERVGDLGEDARAVAGVGLGAGGAAVVEVAQRGEGLVDDLVGRRAGQRRHEGDAAGVVLVPAVVQTLGLAACAVSHRPRPLVDGRRP